MSTKAITVRNISPVAFPRQYKQGLSHYYPELPDFITLDEAHALFDATADHIRDYLLLALMWYGGLRVSEALSFSLDSLRQNDLRVKGKGDKWRIIPLKASLVNDLLQYGLAFNVGYHDRLFPIGRCQAHRLINKYAQKAGLQRKVHCHLLRHGFAVNFLKQMPNLVYLQELLGHSSIETTRIYVRAALPDVRLALEKVEM